jgi:hypothetical protein
MPIEQLIRAVAEINGGVPGATVPVGETTHAETRKRLDYWESFGGALVGLIELKAPGKDADPRKFTNAHDRAQWGKLKVLPNRWYTDGNRVSLWYDGEIVGKPPRFDVDVGAAGRALRPPAGLAALIKHFPDLDADRLQDAEQSRGHRGAAVPVRRDKVLAQLGAENAELRGRLTGGRCCSPTQRTSGSPTPTSMR